MIRGDQMLPQIIAADSTFRLTLADFRKGWNGEQPVLVELGQIARHLIGQIDRGETERFPAIFSVVEQWIEKGDPYVVNAAIVGLLETIQNICSHGPDPADRFLPWLGPKSLLAWQDLNSFWHGQPHAPRK